MSGSRVKASRVKMTFLENQLKEAARKRGLKGRDADRYVYGAMNHMGAKRGNVTTKKGAAMVLEHRANTRGKLGEYERRVKN